MSRKTITTVTCDRCGKDQNHANDEGYAIIATLKGQIVKSSRVSSGGATFEVTMDLCKPCTESFEEWKNINQ